MTKTKKTDEEFFDERLSFILESAKSLKEIDSYLTDEYNDHSVLKLICINYWLGFFLPICEKQLRQPHNYKIAYVDTMAGCGVTSTKRKNDCFCGSCPGSILSSQKINIPFDLVIGVEKEFQKARALEARLNSIFAPEKIIVFNNDINSVSHNIASHLQNKTVSYIVIDPQGLQGMTWNALKPLLSCKGDAMVTWFENEAWRVKTAAVSGTDHPATKAEIVRMTELFGDGWQSTKTAEELTQRFINRVLFECGKHAHAKVKIPRQIKGYYWMILFTGNFQNAQMLASEWENQVRKRIESSAGKEVSQLLDVKTGRQSTLF
jgi:three-Cys-motif partner protein